MCFPRNLMRGGAVRLLLTPTQDHRGAPPEVDLTLPDQPDRGAPSGPCASSAPFIVGFKAIQNSGSDSTSEVQVDT